MSDRINNVNRNGQFKVMGVVLFGMITCLLLPVYSWGYQGDPGEPLDGECPNGSRYFLIEPASSVKYEGADGNFTKFTFTVSRDKNSNPLEPTTWKPGERVKVNYSVEHFPFQSGCSIDFATRVTGRHFWYQGSSFDVLGLDNVDSAIPSEKTALLNGETATFTNYSSFANGITGVVLDLENGPTAKNLDWSDFEFRIGNDNDPDNWDILTHGSAAAPQTLHVIPGANGAYRVVIGWDGAVGPTNTWLQVRMLANDKTGLANDDVSYFGNIVGETGDMDSRVNLLDIALTRSNQTGFSTTDIDNVYDFNRDTRVDLLDVAIARSNQSGFYPVNLITPVAANVTFESNGVLCFGATEPSKTLTVIVRGDSIPELDELFKVQLTSAYTRYAPCSEENSDHRVDLENRAFGTIRNDDGTHARADIVFVLDYSGGMVENVDFLAERSNLDAKSLFGRMQEQMVEYGLVDNQYALITFSAPGTDDEPRSSIVVHQFASSGSPWVTDLTEFEDAICLSSDQPQPDYCPAGDPEAGQDAIAFVVGALRTYPHQVNLSPLMFRDGLPNDPLEPKAIRNIVLITNNESKHYDPAVQDSIIAELTDDQDDCEWILTAITPTTLTGDSADEAQKGLNSSGEVFERANWEHFELVSDQRDYMETRWDIDEFHIRSKPGVADNFALVHDGTLQEAFALINWRTDPAPPLGEKLDESWSIKTLFEIGEAGTKRNARIYFSDTFLSDTTTRNSNDNIDHAAFIEVDATQETDAWTLCKTDPIDGRICVPFFLHDATVWPNIELNEPYEAEVRMVIEPGDLSTQQTSGRLDLFINGHPIASLFLVEEDPDSTIGEILFSDWNQAFSPVIIGVGCDESETAFDWITLSVRTEDKAANDPVALMAQDLTPYDFVPSLAPFKRTFYNDFGKTIDCFGNGSSFHPAVMGADWEGDNTGFAYKYQTDHTAAFTFLLENPDTFNSRQYSEIQYVDLSRDTDASVWNIEYLANPVFDPSKGRDDLMNNWATSFAKVVAKDNLVRNSALQTAPPVIEPVLLGDVNLDGVVDFLDISPFIALLSAGEFQTEADCDENELADFLDISPFIAILIGS